MLVMEMDLEEVTHLKTTKKQICNFSKGVMVVIDIYLYIQVFGVNSEDTHPKTITVWENLVCMT